MYTLQQPKGGVLNPFPWFRYFPSDFSNDENVSVMSTLALGAFHRLLWKAWHQKPVGTLPRDHVKLAQWAEVSDEDWVVVGPQVLKCFKPTKNHRWIQKRMSEEYRQTIENAIEKSDKARKGGFAKSIKDREKRARAMLEHPPSSAIQNQKHTNTTTEEPDVVVVEPSAGAEAAAPPDPVVTALLCGAGIAPSVASELSRTTPLSRAQILIDAGKRRESRGQISRDQIAGYVIKAIRDNYVVDGVTDPSDPPDQRKLKAAKSVAEARKQKESESAAAAFESSRQIKMIETLKPDFLKEIVAEIIAKSDQFVAKRIEKEPDPLKNLTLRALIVKRLEETTHAA